MVAAGLRNPSESTVCKAITKEELARHCRRRTRRTEEAVELIEALLDNFSTMSDSLGVPVLQEDAMEIWAEQWRHVPCLQDPPGVPLYAITGEVSKGGVKLPVYRCARGTTSLESFHLHIARFIPGTLASDVHFQAYLLDGITRWNAARAAQACSSPPSTLRSFDVSLLHRVNALSMVQQRFPCIGCPWPIWGKCLGSSISIGRRGRSLGPEMSIKTLMKDLETATLKQTKACRLPPLMTTRPSLWPGMRRWKAAGLMR